MPAKSSLFGAALAAVVFGSHGALASIVNGSFENPGFSGGSTQFLPSGSTAISGWTVFSDPLAWIRGPDYGLSASDGLYFLDLTSGDDSVPHGGVFQDVVTIPLTFYELKFDLGSSSTYGVPSSIFVSAAAANTTKTSTLSGTDNWETQTWVFQALGALTTISFLGLASPAYIGLDNVSISAVPLPAALPLFLGALGGLAAVGRWRRRRVASATSEGNISVSGLGAH